MKLPSARLNFTRINMWFGVPVAFFATFFIMKTAVLEHRARAQVVARAFVLEMDIYKFSATPSGELLSRKIVARRSDGARARLDTAFGQSGLVTGLMVRRIDFPDGRRISLADWLKSKSSWPLLPTEALAAYKTRLLNPPTDCLTPGETLLGFDFVLDHSVVKIKGRSVANRVMTRWLAPDLACEEVQYRIEIQQQDGSLKLLTIGKPTVLRLGEPDPNLFLEGTDYTERSPSEIVRLGVEKLGITWDKSMEAGEHRIGDRKYYGKKK